LYDILAHNGRAPTPPSPEGWPRTGSRVGTGGDLGPEATPATRRMAPKRRTCRHIRRFGAGKSGSGADGATSSSSLPWPSTRRS